mmetsp:Transcript_20019/g.52490  ORF Transcript_20019/g.52490 Transcript_20019/m.52490 type:complete len:221 (+) Transcript_20019:84-746(+)
MFLASVGWASVPRRAALGPEPVRAGGEAAGRGDEPGRRRVDAGAPVRRYEGGGEAHAHHVGAPRPDRVQQSAPWVQGTALERSRDHEVPERDRLPLRLRPARRLPRQPDDVRRLVVRHGGRPVLVGRLLGLCRARPRGSCEAHRHPGLLRGVVASRAGHRAPGPVPREHPADEAGRGPRGQDHRLRGSDRLAALRGGRVSGQAELPGPRDAHGRLRRVRG